MSIDELVVSLNQLVSVYRHLLDLSGEEQKALASGDWVHVGELNQGKEKMILKIKTLDRQWALIAHSMGQKLSLPGSPPRLLDLAHSLPHPESERLKKIHLVLNELVERVLERNKKNEILVQSALRHISGAMKSVSEAFHETPLYKKSGTVGGGGSLGNLVAKKV